MLTRFRKLLEFFLLLTSPFIFTVDFLIPKNTNKILFYGALGRFTGNPKYLYQYIRDTRNFSCIWLSRDRDETTQLKNNYGEKSVLYIEDFKGIIFLLYHYLTSKILIIQERNNLWPLRQWTSSSRRLVIDLFHGIPLKKTGILVPGRDDPRIERMEIKKRDTVTFHTVPSDLVRYFLAACYSISVRKFPITGDPRNDALIKLLNQQDIIKKRVTEACNVKVNFEHMVLYAPTHRDPGMLGDSGDRRPTFFPFEDWSLKQIDDWLTDNSAILLLRTHNLENKMSKDIPEVSQMPDDVKNSNRIFNCPHQVIPDTCELLAGINLLWTDYSGIYLDFLLTDRPTVFIPYDLEEYKDYRGLLFDYDVITAGPQVETLKGLLNESSRFLAGRDPYQEHRQWMKKLFHKYPEDGDACKRITNIIEKELSLKNGN